MILSSHGCRQTKKMVFTLHRYIFRELARIFILTTFALTLILSLGLVLEPIQKFGVGPGQVIHLLGFFLPITLTFVLPIAALFAATLTYGRLSGDNELDACKASGISPTTIVYPGFVLAILVAIANLLLSFHAMPYFTHKAESTIKADAKQILFRKIQRQGFYIIPEEGYAIFADGANPQEDTLYGVVVVESSKRRLIERIIATDAAKISFDIHGPDPKVRIAALKIIRIEDEQSQETNRFIVELPFKPMLKDNIDFKRIDEIKQIQANPLRFKPIEELVRKTHIQFVTELIYNDVLDALSSDPGFYDFPGEPNSVRIRAGQCSLGPEQNIEFWDDVNDVQIIKYNAQGQEPTFLCKKAILNVEGDEFNPSLTLELRHASPMDKPGSTVYAMIDGLSMPKDYGPGVSEENALARTSRQAIKSVLQARPSPTLKGAMSRQERRIRWKFKGTPENIPSTTMGIHKMDRKSDRVVRWAHKKSSRCAWVNELEMTARLPALSTSCLSEWRVSYEN